MGTKNKTKEPSQKWITRSRNGSYVPALQETKRMRISRILNELYNDVSGKALVIV